MPFITITTFGRDSIFLSRNEYPPVPDWVAAAATPPLYYYFLITISNSVYTLEELIRIGMKIGADVPFFLVGGTALAEGIGEKLTPLEDIE